MSLEETELKIGNRSFKGVYLAILLSLSTTLGGGVWTASSLYGRLTAVEAVEIPDIKPLEEKISLIKQQLVDNDVSQLKSKLAELGVNLSTVLDKQEKLLALRVQITDLEKNVEAMRATVAKAELLANDIEGYDKTMKLLQREVEELWSGLDYLNDPYQRD